MAERPEDDEYVKIQLTHHLEAVAHYAVLQNLRTKTVVF